MAVQQSDMLATGSFLTENRGFQSLVGLYDLAGLSRADQIYLLKSADLPTAYLDSSTLEISSTLYFRLLADLLGFVRSQYSPSVLAFKVAASMHVSHFGILGLALQNVPNIQTAINLALEFRHLLAGSTRLTCLRMRDRLIMRYDPDFAGVVDRQDPVFEDLTQFSLIVDLVTATRFFEDLIGPSPGPCRIGFPFVAAEDIASAQHLFPCSVDFNQDHATLELPVDILALHPLRARPSAYKTYRALLQESLAGSQNGKDSIDHRVRELLMAHTPPLSRTEIAQTLAVSERSLSRSLMQAGTSYRELANGVMAQQATDLLRDKRRSVSEISDMLGYAEPAAFSRAFKESVGIAPSHWRATAKGPIA